METWIIYQETGDKYPPHTIIYPLYFNSFQQAKDYLNIPVNHYGGDVGDTKCREDCDYCKSKWKQITYDLYFKKTIAEEISITYYIMQLKTPEERNWKKRNYEIY